MIHLYEEHKEVLRTVCSAVDDNNKDQLPEICKTLREDLATTRNGIAIASNQCGFNLRVILFNTLKLKDKIIINPEIVSKMSPSSSVEGCLSFPNITVTKNRFKFVKVKFLNENLEPEVLQLSGLDAYCMQHELEHLDGKTFLDNYTGKIKRKE